MTTTINASTSAGLVQTADTSGVLALQTAGTTAVTIDASQNVGIGGTSPAPSAGLPTLSVVAGSGKGATVYLQGNGATGASGGFQLQGGSDSLAYLWNFQNTAMVFATNNAERMRIDSSGNLLVGTTTTVENERATFKRTNTTTSATVITASNSGATSTSKNTNSLVRFASGASNADVNIHLTDVTANDYVVGGNNGGLYCMSNTQGVRLASGGTSWASDSDERLKENLVPILNALNKITTLRAVTGNYIDDKDKRSRSFLIAQDVQAVLPEAIDATDPDRLGLQYTDVIPLLVSAIKELNAKVTALEAQLGAK